MKLKDIYDQLAYGELRHVFIGHGSLDREEEGIPNENFANVLPLVQLGLTELHKRFLLREGTLPVELQTGQVTYVLSKAFAESNTRSKEPVKYIKDAADPFKDNLLRIERIYGTKDAKKYEIPLNVHNSDKAIRTTALDTIVVPDDPDKAPWLSETTDLSIIYRANHPEITSYIANSSPLSTDIYLPHTYLEALLYYIAARYLNPTGAVNEFHEGNMYTQKFEASCALLQDSVFNIEHDTYNTKLADRGFV